MKFIENVKMMGRLGSFVELHPPWQKLEIKTPTFLMYMRAGTIPHLIHDSLQFLENVDLNKIGYMIQPLPTIFELNESVKEYGKGLGVFVGMPDSAIHISVQDPAVLTPSGYNTNKGASVWTHGGKVLLTPEEFMDVMENFRPFSYQAICDSDRPSNCSKKRLHKSVDRTLSFLDTCIEMHRKSQELTGTAIFGTVQAGYDCDLRKKSAEETAKREVDGFVIDGLHQNGPNVQNIKASEVQLILGDIIDFLPSDKPRLLNGPFSPRVIIEAIKCGVDLFDSSYPYLLTENGQALVFYFLNRESDIDISTSKSTKWNLELDLNDTLYADHFSPIVKGCKCYTCTHFTCAYLHHLLVSSELLSRVLLMLHNIYQFTEFFTYVRDCIEKDVLYKVEKLLDVHGI